MHFTHQQLDQLRHTGIFRPNGLNDDRRVDIAEPFLAIDSVHPGEIDDGISAIVVKGGFVVRAAIADGSQIEPNGPLFDRALSARYNRYDAHGSTVRSILPKRIVRALELSPGAGRRALVVEEHLDRDGESQETRLYPATINVQKTSIRTFGQMLRSGHELAVPLFEVTQTRRAHESRPVPVRPDYDSSPRRLDAATHGVVSDFMGRANRAAGLWAQLHDVPILYRRRRQPGDGSIYHTLGYTQDIAEAGSDGHLPTTHFTSPLRRTLDLVNHLQVGHALADRAVPFSAGDLDDIATLLGPAAR